MSNKGKTFFNALGQIIKALWKLFLLCIYGIAKLIETMAVFTSKIAEKGL